MKVFVYGTLMKGFGNHGLLADSTLVDGDAWTLPEYRMFDLGAFPGCAKWDDGAYAIRGEVYELGALTLDALDRLEGHPGFYQRTLVTLADGAEVFMYLLPAGFVHYRHPRMMGVGDWRLARNCSTLSTTGS